ncbi:MAG: M23 family metallopeptidase [Spirochaetales bacterium]|nr:M23 family metallopeptidase [Spirochaetales bacterium]
MSPANQYKKFENKIAFELVRFFRSAAKAVSGFFSRIIQTGKQRFTIMLIPHSEKKIFNFKLSLFSLVFLCILLTGILGTFLVFTTQFTGLNKILTTRSANLESSEASLESIRDELQSLKKTAAKFFDELSATHNTLGLDESDKNGRSTTNGDISSFFGIQEQDESLMRELADLQNLSDSMLQSLDTLKDITQLQESTRKLLADLPNYWPVQGHRRITNYFGFQEHPISKETYLHIGLDIANKRHDPVYSAANGKVIERKFDKLGFGNFIVIAHKAGFSTKYAHLGTVDVKEGDTVVQGQKIGTIGNTGLSTGFHLHFEIRLGSQARDPLIHLRMTDSVTPGLESR